MPWIEAHDTIPEHPKTLQLSAAMGWDVDVCIGKLFRLWWWCLKYAPDGDLRRFNDAQLAAAMGVAMAQADQLKKAMVEACWLDRKPYFRIHGWWDYVGRYLRVKYKDKPDKWKEIESDYSLVASSVTDTATRTTVPTNQPTVPTRPDVGGDCAVEPPKNFPSSPSESCGCIGTVGCSEAFAIDTWDKAMSRGGRDAKDVPIRSWVHYLANQWKYERERLSKEQNAKPKNSFGVDRNAGTANEGRAKDYAKLRPKV